MKDVRRKILIHLNVKNPNQAYIPKLEFPRLLKSIQEQEQLDGKKLMPPAFKKCGLHPLNLEEVLQRILHVQDDDAIAANVDASLLQQLDGVQQGRVGSFKNEVLTYGDVSHAALYVCICIATL